MKRHHATYLQCFITSFAHIQRAALGLSQGSVKSFLESSASQLCYSCSGKKKQQDELLKKQNLYVRPNAVLCRQNWHWKISSHSYSYRIRLFSLMDLSPLNQEMSGSGLASRRHSMMRLSPSCRIVGFLGKRGGMPSGMRGLLPRSLPEIQGKQFIQEDKNINKISKIGARFMD